MDVTNYIIVQRNIGPIAYYKLGMKRNGKWMVVPLIFTLRFKKMKEILIGYEQGRRKKLGLPTKGFELKYYYSGNGVPECVEHYEHVKVEDIK